MTVEDEALFAVEAKAVAGARRGRRDPVGAVLGAFVDRERDDRLSRSNGGEPPAGLRAARLCQRGARAHARPQERRRGERTGAGVGTSGYVRGGFRGGTI